MGDQHSEALLLGVLETVPDAVVVADRDGRIVLANARCRVVFDRAPDELVGQSLRVLLPEALDRGLRPDGPLRLNAVRRDGSEFPAEVSLAPIGTDGEHVSATIRDATPGRHDEARFHSLLEAAPDPTVIIDSTSTIVLANNRMEQAFGYPRDELVGRRMDVLAVPGAEQETLDGFAAYLRSPDRVPMGFTRELEVRRRDGRTVPVEVSLASLATDEGLLVSVAIRDVSERLRIQAESQRMRDELVATVSHELRTPLTSIIGYSELMSDLGEEDLSRRARKLLEVIERNAARELQLVDDLLTLAFLDAQRIQVAHDPVSLAAVARLVVEDHAVRARASDVELRLVDGNVPPVRGDFLRLVQVTENLVDNALKFTQPGGRVEVSVGEHGSMGLIEVRDTGVGVAPPERAKLFDRLYRTPTAVASQKPGAGLGLPIVRAIVEALGGWVDLESELGVGTVVRVAVPYADPAAATTG